MADEMETRESRDARPKYEPPTVLRMSDTRARAGALCDGSGSGDGGVCDANGSTAGANCEGNGSIAVALCDAFGVGGELP